MPTKVRSIDLHGIGKDAGSKAIQSWLNHVKESYSSRALDFETKEMETEIEQLMAQWPEEFDQALSNNEV